MSKNEQSMDDAMSTDNIRHLSPLSRNLQPVTNCLIDLKATNSIQEQQEGPPYVKSAVLNYEQLKVCKVFLQYTLLIAVF